MYASHLLEKLRDWLEQENLIEDEQAGFRAERSTVEHGLIMQHLVEKYTSTPGGALYAAFVDLRSAFDLVPRDKLWEKFEDTNIDRRLLRLIRTLYENTSLQVRCSSAGHLTRLIPTARGVKQGCVLAPTLFNFYINSMVRCLAEVRAQPPSLSNRLLTVLLYADDAVILSLTRAGLRRLLRTLDTYCKTEGLQINYDKTKVLVFSRSKLKCKWQISDHLIEQVSTYRYLGITFHATGTWRPHLKNAIANVQRSIKALLSFYYNKGGQHIPSALQVFNAKVLAQILYGIEVCTFDNIVPMEVVQTKFLRAILGLPNCIPNTLVRIEAGQPTIEARMWRRKMQFWLKMLFVPVGLAPLTLTDTFHSKWKKTLSMKLQNLGFSLTAIQILGYEKAKAAIAQRIYDVDLQTHLSQAILYHGCRDYRSPLGLAKHLINLTVPGLRRAFTLAKFNVLPSALLEGRYKKIPHTERTCPCGTGDIETADHVLLHCCFYKELRTIWIAPLINKVPGRPDKFYPDYLLADLDDQVTSKVAKFCAAAILKSPNSVQQPFVGVGKY